MRPDPPRHAGICIKLQGSSSTMFCLVMGKQENALITSFNGATNCLVFGVSLQDISTYS